MIDNFEYTYLPKGKVIICACDQVYFEIFFYKLYTSFTKNISEFNQLHIHLINPDINLINSIISSHPVIIRKLYCSKNMLSRDFFTLPIDQFY